MGLSLVLDNYVYLHMSSDEHISQDFEITMFGIFDFSDSPRILSRANSLVVYHEHHIGANNREWHALL